jgi:hypothetical protein
MTTRMFFQDGTLKEFRELLGCQLAIAEDLMKEARADNFARVHRYDCTSPILMSQEMMAAFDAYDLETSLLERLDKVGAACAWAAAHAAIVTR